MNNSNPLSILSLDLNLEYLKDKLLATNQFYNFSYYNGSLHCEHFGWMIDFHQDGTAVISLPEEPMAYELIDTEKESISFVRQVNFLHRETHYSDDVDFCLSLALNVAYNPIEYRAS